MTTLVRTAISTDQAQLDSLLQQSGEQAGFVCLLTSDASVFNWDDEAVLHRLVAVDSGSGTMVGFAVIDRPEGAKGSTLRVSHMVTRSQGDAGRRLLESVTETAGAHSARASIVVGRSDIDAQQLFDASGWRQVIDSDSDDGPTFTYQSPEPALDSSQRHASWSIETLAVHAGAPHEAPGPVVPPIVLSSTFRQTRPAVYGKHDYARSSNPTRDALEEALTELEGGVGAGAFASGLAAIDAVLRLLEPGQRVVVSNDVYGGTWRLLDTVWVKLGLIVESVDLTDLPTARPVIEQASLVIVESPSNPLLRIIDIPALCEIAHAAGAVVLVDNTFATPYLQRPLDLGADLVVHSTTKYLGGHSDVVGGAVVAKSAEHVDRIHYLQKVAGAVAGQLDSYLVLRGLRTLAVRMDRQCDNAQAIAEMLRDHDGVEAVYFPGLETDPGYEVLRRQMTRPGGMISFRPVGGVQAALRIVDRCKLFTLAESLGAVESLIELPAVMTHASTADSLFAVPADLIRLSIGIENVADQLEDLRHALAE